MAPERALHAAVKFAAQTALLAAIRRAGLPCHKLPDGMTVRIDRHTAHEPDALVYRGEKVSDASLEVRNPVILLEVLSPSTRRIDAAAKLVGYFRLPSVQHYVILDPQTRVAVHHARGEGEAIATMVRHDGKLRLDPPGLEVAVQDLFEA